MNDEIYPDASAFTDLLLKDIQEGADFDSWMRGFIAALEFIIQDESRRTNTQLRHRLKFAKFIKSLNKDGLVL